MTRYIAFGDIHGHADELIQLLREIKIEDEDVLVFLGDYIDRGADSKGVINTLINLQGVFGDQRIVLLRGNHEDMIERAMCDKRYTKWWFNNGGKATAESFGMEYPFMEVEPYIQDFLDSLLPYYAPNDKLLFVHAGINPEFPLSEQVEEDLLWIRGPFLLSEKDFGFKVVHGHTPVEAVDVRPNRINVDTGGCFGGHLSAVILDEEGNVIKIHSVKCEKKVVDNAE